MKYNWQRIAGLFLIWTLTALPLVIAQEMGDGTPPDQEGPGEEETLPIESDWKGYTPTRYSPGDKTFVIAAGVSVPLFFYGPSGFLDNKVSLGGTGYLSYNYFLSPHIFIGGELGGSFAATLGENMLYIVPFGFRVGYQLVTGRFEFPFSLTIGAANQGYLDKGYFGLFIKPAAALFWRFNPDWSFGLSTEYWWVPQWVSDSSKNSYGNFLTINLAARYHF